ncbi:MAG: hypothetical protein ACI9LM_003742 [Alteromonadaceae bacterium]|jgi:hypothetical protein
MNDETVTPTSVAPLTTQEKEISSPSNNQGNNNTENASFFDNLASNWFLQMNSTLSSIIANSIQNKDDSGDTVNKENINLTVLSKQFTDFFIAIKSQHLLPKDQQLLAAQADEFSKFYPDLLEGITYLYIASLAPELAQGRFDYGAEKDRRQQQKTDITNVYEFFNHFYCYLLTQQPRLPILYVEKSLVA